VVTDQSRLRNGNLTLSASIQKEIRVSDTFASCINCLNSRKDKDPTNGVEAIFCKKYKQYPPLDVVVNSCIEGYDDIDEIPF